ncbi:VOC family protein [Alteromonas flava]|uniref:VOC family protein n=1 Tax=Alteromonas flava TaxID=2048003 RepID=UPI000C287A2B|nr:VOC family protein [Alteromonas flava]
MSDNNISSIEAVGQIAITVSDVQNALAFYRDILGLTFLFAPTENLAFLQSGDVRIMLSTPQGAGEIGKNSIVYFKLANIEAFYQHALDNGAQQERSPALAAQMPDHELWTAFVRDPDNNLVGLMEEKRL